MGRMADIMYGNEQNLVADGASTQAASGLEKRVRGEGGWTGTLEPAPRIEDHVAEPIPQVRVRLDSGASVVVPAELLKQEDDGVYFLPLRQSEIEAYSLMEERGDGADATLILPRPSSGMAKSDTFPATDGSGRSFAAAAAPLGQVTSLLEDGQGSVVIPVIEEQLQVETRVVETGTVRIAKTVGTREETISQPLMREDLTVERVPVNRVVQEATPIRYEGETMIVPLLEEVLYVEKRLVLKEELRITLRKNVTEHTETVTLRREDAQIERIEPDSSAATVTTPNKDNVAGQER